MKYFVILMLALTYGCDDAQVPQPDDAEVTSIASPTLAEPEQARMNVHSEKLSSLSEPEKLKFIGTAVKSSGVKCNAERVMFNGSTPDGQDFWSVDCGDADQILSIKANSETNTLDCAVMAQFGTPCWERWSS